MLGADHQPHTIKVEADSVFEAADKAVQSWAKFWWFDPAALLTVKDRDQSWTVTPKRIRQWRSQRA